MAVRIAVIVTARPSWAKLQTVCEALAKRPDVELQIIACASALLERYGRVVDVITAEGFNIAAEVWSVYEGETLLTSAKETGALCSGLCERLSALRSDVVVVCADRHEVLGAAQAASYLHLPLTHLQGGERTGSIDDRVRDAITALADYHCTATRRAQMRVYSLTGAPERVIWTGCPSIDLAKRAQSEPPVTVEELGGSGDPIDLSRPFVVVLNHPVTTEVGAAARQQAILVNDVLPRLDTQALVLWPGEDAGAGAMSKVIRASTTRMHTVRNLPPSRFLKLLTQSACLIGNSSAGIRECSYLGVPVVNIGSRQQGRERGPNVVDVPSGHYDEILAAVTRQIAYGPYPSSNLYGRGDSGERIAEVLCERVSHHSCARR